jgi:hypothetical protein
MKENDIGDGVFLEIALVEITLIIGGVVITLTLGKEDLRLSL